MAQRPRDDKTAGPGVRRDVPGYEPHGRGEEGWWMEEAEEPDERIQNDVCARLAAGGRIDPRAITVSVAQGVVRLEGAVEDPLIVQPVLDCVAEVAGVRAVDNRLLVRR